MKSYVKDILRMVRKRYLLIISIALILSLGIGFYIGISVTGYDMKKTGDTYYKDKKLFDINLKSTAFPFDNSDIMKYKTDNIDAFGVLQLDLITQYDDVVTFVQINDETLNDLTLKSGSMPKHQNEILLDSKYALIHGIKIGDKITIKNRQMSMFGTVFDIFSEKEMVVTGIIRSVLFINADRGTTDLLDGKLSGYAYMKEGNLSDIVYDFYPNLYTDIRLKYKDLSSLYSYEEKYQLKLEEYKKTIETKVSDEDIYVQSRATKIIGYSAYYDDSDRITAIGTVFPLIFFLVAALVTFNAITRMVEESRNECGIYKSIGYTPSMIALRFIFIPTIALIVGLILGSALGYILLPKIIYNAYRILYEMPDIILSVKLSYFIFPAVVACISSVFIAYIKSYRVSKIKTAQLLRPKAPAKGKRILLEKISFIWNRLSFSYKVSFRNLFRSKSRFFMMLLGIAGCMGLIMTGFSLRASINSIPTKQFNEIELYDLRINTKLSDKTLLEQTLNEKTYIEAYNPIYAFTTNFLVNGSINPLVIYVDLSIPSETTKEVGLDSMIKRNLKKSSLDEGIIITEKMASLLKVKPNDSIDLTVDNKNVNVKIKAISENYVYHYAFFDLEYFEKVTAKTPIANTVFLKTNSNLTQEDIAKDLLLDEQIISIAKTNELLDMYEKQMTSLNTVILVVIISAMLLATFVIVTLVSMTISERERELATLKVLGFYQHELINYIIRENIITTIISLIFGSVFGYLLSNFVIKSAEVDIVMFDRRIYFLTYVIAGSVTLLLSVVINLLMSANIKKIDMLSSLKSFE